MIIDSQLPQNRDNFYFLYNFESKTKENYNNNLLIPTNPHNNENGDNPIDFTDTNNNFYHNIFIDKNISFDFEEEENSEDLYFIKNHLVSDKKNVNTINTDKKIKSEKELMTKKRKIKRKNKHNKFDKDNVMKKINIHFISFIVKYVNFNIKRLISKSHPLFSNLSYDFKKKLNNNTFKQLKSMTIGEVLKNEGSSKNKRNMNYQKDENEKIFNSIYKTDLKDLLDINYIQFFRQVYMKTPIKNTLTVLKKYNAPKNILYFNDFIKSEVEKDKINEQLYKKRLEYISKSEFVNDEFPFFETKIIYKKNIKK